MQSQKTWIKLFRKLRGHEIMSDPTALQIFIWILISVDYKTGKMITGRFWASEELKIKPRTFHKAVTERLRDRFNLVTLSSDNRKTVISVNNWSKYQAVSDTFSDKPVTPKGQQSDTKQEYKNIRNKDNNTLSIEKFIKSWNETMGTDYRVTKGRKQKLKARLNTFTVKELKIAFVQMMSNPFYRGESDRGWTATPDYFLRNDEIIDRFLSKYKTKMKG